VANNVKQRTISTLDELTALEAIVLASARGTLQSVRDRLIVDSELAALALLKFDRAGCDPLDAARSLNFIEQLNQTFTYLATIQGARWLLEHHPEHAPYVLNLGTSPGSDICSQDGCVIAETFAATHPDSNRKIAKDIAKAKRASASRKFVFYLSRAEARIASSGDVTVVRVDHPSLTLGLPRET
jgi:hypothetical protein